MACNKVVAAAVMAFCFMFDGAFAQDAGLVRLVRGNNSFSASAMTSSAEAATPPESGKDQTLQCAFRRMEKRDNDMGGEAILQLSGEKLRWFEPVVLLGPKTNPPYTGLVYQVLKRDGVGIVAVMSYTDRFEDVGPVLGAKVLTVRKSDGFLRVGTVSANGLRNEIEGACK